MSAVPIEIREYIDKAKEASHALLDQNYLPVAQAFTDISLMIMRANEKSLNWLSRFSYFDFENANSKKDFSELLAEYNSKRKEGFNELKFKCSELLQKYNIFIRPHRDHLFKNKDEADTIFNKLGHSDLKMKDFLKNEFLIELDSFVDDLTDAVNRGDIREAERKKMQFHKKSKNMRDQLETSYDELADTIEEFNLFLSTYKDRQ